MKNTAKLKLYVIRKYVMAISAEHAIQQEKTKCVDDVWVSEKDDTIKGESCEKDAIGFTVE